MFISIWLTSYELIFVLKLKKKKKVNKLLHTEKNDVFLQLQANTYLIQLDPQCSTAAATQKIDLKMKKGKVRRMEMPRDAAMTDLSNAPWLIPPWTWSCMPLLLPFWIFFSLFSAAHRQTSRKVLDYNTIIDASFYHWPSFKVPWLPFMGLTAGCGFNSRLCILSTFPMRLTRTWFWSLPSSHCCLLVQPY